MLRLFVVEDLERRLRQAAYRVTFGVSHSHIGQNDSGICLNGASGLRGGRIISLCIRLARRRHRGLRARQVKRSGKEDACENRR